MSTISLEVYAIRLSKDNIPTIVEETKKHGWNLDHLQDNLEVNRDDGYDTWLILKLWPGTTDVATFNDVPWDVASDNTWRMTEGLDPKFGLFHPVEKI